MKDYKKFYNLEKYLLEEVRDNFKKRGYLNADEFFCIVIWKANRSKTKIKARLERFDKDLYTAVRKITAELFKKGNPKERLGYLMSCGFRLPTASAILTVLYPDEFTVYDVRVCDMLKNFHKLKNKIKFDKIWEGYEEFKEAVAAAVPEEVNLRDKDRYLWGKSFCEGLKKFLESKRGQKKKEESGREI